MTVSDWIQSLYFPLYTTWGITWFLVMVEYGRASYWTWEARGGRWGQLLPSAWLCAKWYAFNLRNDFMFQRAAQSPVISKEDSGYWLRIFVSMSSFNIGLLGTSMGLLNRTTWYWWQHVLVIFGVTVSIIAGQGHLLLSWNDDSRRWRRYQMFLAIWFVAALMYRVHIYKGDGI